MAVVFLKYANRLAPCVHHKGLSRTEAMARADANVLTLRDAGVDQIDGCLEKIRQQVHALVRDPEEAGRVIYDNANTIGGVAAVFGFPDLGAVAYGLCDLMGHFEDGGDINIDAVKVHAFTLELFRHPENLKSTEINSTIKYLEKLRDHILIKSNTIKT